MKKILIDCQTLDTINKKRGDFSPLFSYAPQLSQSGLSNGGFDEVFSYNYSDIDDEFKEKNKHILEQPRGAGFWLWKPYIIKKTLEKIEENDLLFYSDSGISFIRPIDDLIKIMDETDEKLLLFELDFLREFLTLVRKTRCL